MSIALGIDTGGTYTDAVLVNYDKSEVLAGAKALTTPHDFSIGIREAVVNVLSQNKHAVSHDAIELVGLSTTLATNAIVEGHGSPVCLLLIGYDPELISQYGFEPDLVTHDVVYVNGGHNGDGDEVQPLDETAAREAILTRRDHVDAFAISGYFGVRNPSHEIRVRTFVEELTKQSNGLSMPVTCGHELTTQLDSIRRATTAVLNACLIPLLQELIATVHHTLDTMNIPAPLMIVKGDGSLVRAEWAMHRPIETILSGPAASVVGASYLIGRQDAWVVDIGGTTTDIAMLESGCPRLSPEGAQVGRWRTMVEAVDIRTIGLGGDSQVSSNGSRSLVHGRLAIGPRRILPLCLLASQYPQIISELHGQIGEKQRLRLTGKFVLAQRQPFHTLSKKDAELLEVLAAGPQSLTSLSSDPRFKFSLLQQIGDLAAKQLILQAGFTPTDALHVLGYFERWNSEASQLGAELLTIQCHLSPKELCQKVISGVSDQIAGELVGKILYEETGFSTWEQDPAVVGLLTRAFDDSQGSELACQLILKRPIIAIGAPVEAYLPRTARQLHTELHIPDYASVANAVGAVAGGVVQRIRVLVHYVDQSVFRFYLPDENHDFEELEEGVAYAQKVISARLEVMAREAGADQIEVSMVRKDSYGSSKGAQDALYLSTELLFTAMGRPGLAR